MLKFIVMSDLHLVPTGEMSEGLDTAERLRVAVRCVNREHADFDFCVLAGDLTDHGDVASYRRLADFVRGFDIPCYMTLGNHDHRERFKEVFGELHQDDAGFVQTVVDSKGYRVIVLDSSEPGRGDGVLCQQRLRWLAERLAEAEDRLVIVIHHHHAIPHRTDVDRLILEDADAFISTLKRHPNVQHVIAGHVHYASTGFYRGLPFTTLAGNTYGVTIHLPGMPGEMQHLDGTAQYAVVLADGDCVTVHFHNYIDRHAVPLDHGA